MYNLETGMYLGLEQFDETIILRTASILDTNAFEIRPFNKGSKVRAVFPEAAMLSHDCVPNTRHVFDENMQIQILSTGTFRSLYYYKCIKLCVFCSQWTSQRTLSSAFRIRNR